MAGGRPRKKTAVATGKIGKQAAASRMRQEEELKLQRDALAPPAWLNEEAAAEFSRVVEEASKIDILDNLDLAVLAIYANAYTMYLQTVNKIAKFGLTGKRETLYGTYEVISPYVVAQDKYVKQIMLCSSKLGLATTDRLKLIVPTSDAGSKSENKFLRFVK
ncbi:MAG: phage terminase small subunit P27 family [Acholeplasmataceae bacterium]|nr:phage terminase small subunit P27 family [Acholeplasmataceae bacterium]